MTTVFISEFPIFYGLNFPLRELQACAIFKVGAGKTTTALLAATQLAEAGATVTIIDGDPERWISQWGALPGKPDNVRIISNVTEDTIVDVIEREAAQAKFVIVDLEGTASLMVANAIGMSDFVTR